MTVSLVPPGVETRYLISDGKSEVMKFKWYRSEEAGRDMGESAIKQWICEHWNGYLRSRWLEHLHGKTHWYELRRCAFGILSRHNHNSALLKEIVDKLKEGRENLDVIIWAIEKERPLDEVKAILADVDINSTHIKDELEAAIRNPAI